VAGTRLTFGDVEAIRPSWRPDGSRILYGERRGIRITLVSQRSDGMGGRRVLMDGVGLSLKDMIALYGPAGRRLLYGVDDSGILRLRIADIDENDTPSEERTFFAEEPDPSVIDARLSPDGRFLAYVSVETGRPEVFLTRFPGGTGRWQISHDGGRSPRWARDTGELFFVAGSGPLSRTMTVAELSLESSVRVVSMSDLFTLREANLPGLGDGGFEVAPDGQRLAAVRAAGGASSPARMILVQSWMELFRSDR
jgi:Tol biopolymer transport system component